MTAFWLQLSAPFAAFRPLQAGSYRASTRCMPPSAAYGLVLNLAGVELRQGGALPGLRLALGQVRAPEVAVLCQQLHGYGAGHDGAAIRGRGHGQKGWIAPVRRELLVGFEAIVAVEAEDELAEELQATLEGRPRRPRYGLPFAGDNNLMFDLIQASRLPLAAQWLTPVGAADLARPGSERLTVWIDRVDSARSRWLLMAPAAEPRTHPPPEAWLDFPGGGSTQPGI